MKRIIAFFKGLSLTTRFMLLSLVILVICGLGIGAWMGSQIHTNAVHHAGITSALYVDSSVGPLLQELGSQPNISPANAQRLSKLLADTPLGKQIVTFKVWDTTGKVIYSTDQQAIGQTFPMQGGLLKATQGEVSSEISNLAEQENAPQKEIRSKLLETYAPVWLSGTDQVIAVAEFYQTVDDLENEVTTSQRESWLVVGGEMLLIFLLLSGIVRQASDTILRQQRELSEQVVRLRELLAQNQELNERVRRASASVTMLNENFLRRIGAELHDGPAQDLGLALLKLDTVIGHYEKEPKESAVVDQLNTVQSSVQNAMKEVRSIAGGLSLPQLMNLNLTETVTRAVRSHERKNGVKVAINLQISASAEAAPLPVKITLYRLLQEALNNAQKHAAGADVQVAVSTDTQAVTAQIIDQGPGFDVQKAAQDSARLGLLGMRERVESLGGRFQIQSQPGEGTTLTAQIPLRPEGNL